MNLYLDHASQEALQREAMRVGVGSVSHYVRVLGAFLATPAAAGDPLEDVRERVRERLRAIAREERRR